MPQQVFCMGYVSRHCLRISEKKRRGVFKGKDLYLAYHFCEQLLICRLLSDHFFSADCYSMDTEGIYRIFYHTEEAWWKEEKNG